jgi:hypothetical protein
VKHFTRGKPRGIEKKAGVISWNRNSGASAINVAYHLGAKLIVLLGFDMKSAGDAPEDMNWHTDHLTMGLNKNNPKQNIFKRFLQCFPDIAVDADTLGIKIINANPDSAIDCFETMALEEAMKLPDIVL